MKNLTPIPRHERPALPDFAPVPRRNARHDGWTPERQRAFIEALADTGSVSTAAREVNMSSESAYALRRHPEAGPFRAAWEAALDMGVMRLRDEAFDRAMNGQLVPVFVGGQLMGYRRKKNDRLLMFCLRHYGQDTAGRRVRVGGFAPREQPPERDGGTLTPTPLPLTGEEQARQRQAEGPDEAQALLPAPESVVAAFGGIALDEQAQAEIARILKANAARQRDEPLLNEPFLYECETGPYAGEYLASPHGPVPEPFTEREQSWTQLADPDPEELLAAMRERTATEAPPRTRKSRRSRE